MKKKTKLKTKKGITLIALIITIAILIIITAVSISAFSDSGLIGKAMNASTKDKFAKLEEELKLEINSNVLKEVTGENTENIENIFKKYAYNGKIQSEDGKRYIQLKENGEKIYLSDYNNEGLVTNGTDGVWSDILKMNTPKLANGMKAVYWDEEDNEIVQGAENFDIQNWYNYKENINGANDSKWANAIITDSNENKSYFVWIPRYEYKITYYTDSTKTTQKTNNEFSKYGTIDVNFIPVTQTTATEGYKIHPAFEDGTLNNYTNGEWDKELSGIWVAKYEMSRTDAEIDKAGTATTFKSVPSVQSARSISIGNMYTYCQAFDTNIGNESLDSHLMKNSEWGAVAYLTHSKYGRNGVEIAVNTSSDFITGNEGILTSTTGNITGIYDLSGGAWEYTAGYITNGNSNLGYGSAANDTGFIDSTRKEENAEGYKTLSTKYATAYPYFKSDEDTPNVTSGDNIGDNYNAHRNLRTKNYGYGDALCETTSWNGDNAYFACSSNPFFARGGAYLDGASAGVFASAYGRYRGGGGANDNLGFRAVLAF